MSTNLDVIRAAIRASQSADGPIVRAVKAAVAVDCGDLWDSWLFTQTRPILARAFLVDPVRFNGDNTDLLIMRACNEQGRFWQVQECIY